MPLDNNELTYVQEYLNIKETEVSTTSANDGWHIQVIKNLLNKCGFNFTQEPSNSYINNQIKYDIYMETAVMDFQEYKGLEKTGIINSETLRTLVYEAEKRASDTITSEEEEDDVENEEESTSPHYNPFFSANNIKDARKNNQDIIIALGNNTIVKTIHNVYMRGVSVEYDTSGNPISETYEFIAQDLTESDEPNDQSKYEE